MKANLSNFFALDLGSSKIAGVAAYVDKKGYVTILSHHLHYSEGFKSGSITDLKAAENSIIGAIYALEKDCTKNVKEVLISISGGGTKSYYTNGKIRINGASISKQDIKKLIQKIISDFPAKNLEIIHYFPIEFVIDEVNIVNDPLGMIAKELSCRLHLVTVDSGIVNNISNCFENCQIGVNNIVLAIYASGLACLSNDEKELGAIIIDLGAKTTSFGVFLSGKLIYTGHLAIGGWNITYDIAKIFSVSTDAAEKLKALHGNAIPASFDKDNQINIDDFSSDATYGPSMIITAGQLSEVINSRMEEILKLTKEQYDKAGIDHLIARRLVITGGGSSLRGVKELAAKIFDKQVRIGKPTILPGFLENCSPSTYSTAIGLVKYQAIIKQKDCLENSIIKGSSWSQKVIAWLKANI